ncbi:MAG: FtsX-like permease family protein [Phycisphaerae bacterium]|nr:FtsX-like permease family protein [Phycisphaerae bacterium]
MIVVEKTRDIGIIKSLGGSAQGVAAVFLIYGAAIGVVGATLGSIIGAVFVRYINEVQDWLARLNPEWRIWSPQTYSFDRIPDTVKLDEMLWIAGLAILAAIVGAVAPALRAARTWPVEALRYE